MSDATMQVISREMMEAAADTIERQRGEIARLENRLADALAEVDRLRAVLEPFANAVFYDNGNITVDRSVDPEKLIRAYFALRSL